MSTHLHFEVFASQQFVFWDDGFPLILVPLPSDIASPAGLNSAHIDDLNISHIFIKENNINIKEKIQLFLAETYFCVQG